MLLENGLLQTPDFLDMDDGEPSFLASVRPRVKRANCKLLSCEFFVDKSLEEIFRTAFEVGYDRIVQASAISRAGTGRDATGTHWARALCVKDAGVELAQPFWHFIARATRVKVEKSYTTFMFLVRRNRSGQAFRFLTGPSSVARGGERSRKKDQCR